MFKAKKNEKKCTNTQSTEIMIFGMHLLAKL